MINKMLRYLFLTIILACVSSQPLVSMNSNQWKKCPQCDKSLLSSIALHLKDNCRALITCPLCKKTFSTQWYRNKHLSTFCPMRLSSTKKIVPQDIQPFAQKLQKLSATQPTTNSPQSLPQNNKPCIKSSDDNLSALPQELLDELKKDDL